MAHQLAAARFACFAQQAELLQTAAMAFWNATTELMGSPEIRLILGEGLEDLASLMCGLKCPDAQFQVMFLCFLSPWGQHSRHLCYRLQGSHALVMSAASGSG